MGNVVRYKSRTEEEARNLKGELGGGVHFIYTGELAKIFICRIFQGCGNWKPGKLAEECMKCKHRGRVGRKKS